ncbi:MAG: trigger factor [Nitrococcus mobilis]|nr:trigger factor [Nitrococcus mobilis]
MNRRPPADHDPRPKQPRNEVGSMQVSVETTQGLERRLRFQVSNERIDKEVKSRLTSLKSKVRLDGFRPGKVPYKVVEKRYGAEVRDEVLSELLRASYVEAMEQKGLRPAGAPDIQPLPTAEGEDLEYTATFEVLPEIEIKGLDELEVERPAVEITDADLDKVLEQLRRQKVDYVEVERPSTDNDRITIDFTGQVDGAGFKGDRGKDVGVRIGSGQMPAEFEQALKGLRAEDVKDISYRFPENVPDQQLAGKTAVFHVTVNRVEEPQLPALDDEFAKRLGIEEGGLEQLRAQVRESLEFERDRAVRARLKQQVLDKLLARNDALELPQSLVNAELKVLRERALRRMQQAGSDEQAPDIPDSALEQGARRRVTLYLLINEIVRSNDLRLDEGRLQEALNELASKHDRPQELLQYYMEHRQMMENLELAVVEDQAVDWVLERVKTLDRAMSFDELMGINSGTEDQGSESEGEGNEVNA